MSNIPQIHNTISPISGEKVKFNKQNIPVFFHNEKPYVAMRPICENIGLDWNGQLQRIKRNHILSQGMCMIHTPSKGGEQQALCLPIGYLNGWLFGIDVNRVKPEIKPTLIKYQLECFDVLYKHFMPKVAEQHPNTITIEQQQHIKQAVLDKCHREGKHYQAVYNEFYRVFDIPRYQELPVNKYDEALVWLNNGFAQQSKQPAQIELIKNLVDAVLSQNFMTSHIYRALYTLDEDKGSYFAEYAFKTNIAVLKLSRAMDLRDSQNRKLISDDLRFGTSTKGQGFSGSRWFHPLVESGKLIGALQISGGW